MSSVYKLKDGRYRGVVYLPRNPGDTKQKRKEIYARTRREVNIKVAELEAMIRGQNYTDPSNITLEAFASRWVDMYCQKLAQTTQAYYRMTINKHIIPELGEIKLQSIRPIQIQNMVNRKSETLKNKTIIKIMVILNRIMDEALKNKLITSNPCAQLRRLKKEEYVPNVYTDKEIMFLLGAIQGTMDEIAVVLAAYLGLRRGEVFGLRWSDIDFKTGMISISETITRFDRYVTKDPKSAAGIRTIKAPQFIMDLLKEWRMKSDKRFEHICNDYLPGAYSAHFNKLITKIGLPPTRFHDLRHFNATMMMGNNIPDVVAASRLGHSDKSMTRYYQHTQKSMDDLAAQAIEESFNKARDSK